MSINGCNIIQRYDYDLSFDIHSSRVLIVPLIHPLPHEWKSIRIIRANNTIHLNLSGTYAVW